MRVQARTQTRTSKKTAIKLIPVIQKIQQTSNGKTAFIIKPMIHATGKYNKVVNKKSGDESIIRPVKVSLKEYSEETITTASRQGSEPDSDVPKLVLAAIVSYTVVSFGGLLLFGCV